MDRLGDRLEGANSVVVVGGGGGRLIDLVALGRKLSKLTQTGSNIIMQLSDRWRRGPTRQPSGGTCFMSLIMWLEFDAERIMRVCVCLCDL